MKQILILLGASLLLACPMDQPVARATGTAISISGSSFSPLVLDVTSGQTVTFTNQDSFDHTVEFTSVPGGAAPANSGNLAQNGTFQVTLTVIGTYQYRCGIHTSMTGSIVVQ